MEVNAPVNLCRKQFYNIPGEITVGGRLRCAQTSWPEVRLAEGNSSLRNRSALQREDQRKQPNTN